MTLAQFDQQKTIESIQGNSMRQMLISFYDEHLYRGDISDPNQLFTQHDKEEALAYFDGKDANISTEELFQRRTRSVFMLSKTKAWAQQQKTNFLERLYSLDIALATKKTLEEHFMHGSFERKSTLFDFVRSEERRVASKKTAQLEERESYKLKFISFYESHSQYFCYEDRVSAWSNVLESLSKVRTHKAKMQRLQVLLAMLPANLAYAQQIEQEYVTLLNEKIAEQHRKEACLDAFRKCTFYHKAERIAELKKSPNLEIEKDKEQQKKLGNRTLYSALRSIFPHGMSIEDFEQLTSEAQLRMISTRQKQNDLEEEEMKKLIAMKEMTAEECAHFRTLSLDEKKTYIAQQRTVQTVTVSEKKTNLDPEQSAPKEGKSIPLCHIVAQVLRNKDKKVFPSDKERIELIREKMSYAGLHAEFSEQHLSIIRSLLLLFPEEEIENPSVLQWVAERLKQKVYVGETQVSSSRTTLQQKIAA